MHHPVGPAWAEAVEDSGLGMLMRESLLAYPAANLLHIFGIALLVGPILALDLRLLGFARIVALPAASKLLTPVAVTGLLLLIVSGPPLFAADAGPLAVHPLMQVKMALALLAVANALLFRWLWHKRLADWDAAPPALGRAQAVASILLWLTIAACGRLIAYM
jgi:hypothetical protein